MSFLYLSNGINFLFIYYLLEYHCGPRISAHVFPLDGELDFYLKNDLLIMKMT